MEFGNTPPAPNMQDDDHVLWWKFAKAAASYGAFKGETSNIPLNQDDDHILLYKAAQSFFNLT